MKYMEKSLQCKASAYQNEVTKTKEVWLQTQIKMLGISIKNLK